MVMSMGVRCVLALLVVAFTMSQASAAAQGDKFMRLDSLIAAQPTIIADKEQQLSLLKAQLDKVRAPLERYEAYKKLYEEYAAYQYDSAYSYVSQCISLAEAMGDVALLNEARLNLAHILSTACLMEKAQQTLHQIDTTRLTPSQLLRYRRTQANLYIYQAEYFQGTQYASGYIDKLIGLRRAITAMDVPRDDVNYQLTVAECEADAQRYDRAIGLLDSLMRHYRSGDRLYSIITSMISFYYSQKGEKDAQMQYLIMSAESDLEGCVRENTSLRTIADRLFDEGDIDRAYRYMRVAVDDANFYGTRLRNIQSSHIVPKILSAYQTKQDQGRRNILWLLAAISVVAAMLIVGVIAIYQLLKRYRRLNEQKKSINEQLRRVNAQLGDTVERLHETNALLREREKLKEE